MKKTVTLAALLLLLTGSLSVIGCGPKADQAAKDGQQTGQTGEEAQVARDYISIVGSSTVYPFATVVAEQFGKTTDFKTPKIESTGSGGGFKLFSAGVGVEHPDITNASRRIKKSECESALKTV